MLNQTGQNSAGSNVNNFRQLNTIQNAAQANSNFNTLNSYGGEPAGNNAGQSIVPSTAVTHRQNHKRNSNAGGIAKIGRTGMMTPNGMMNEGH